MRTPHLFLVAVLFVAYPCAWVEAADTQLERATLKGLTRVAVLVDELSPDAEQAGLTREQLQTDIETRLRQFGITVAHWDTSTPYLYVNVTALKHASGNSYAYAGDIQLVQLVTLVNSDLVTGAATWSSGFVSTVGRSRFPESVREDVRDYVDKFVSAFLSANSKGKGLSKTSAAFRSPSSNIWRTALPLFALPRQRDGQSLDRVP